jgi:alcohol dehydrogenase
MFSDFQYTSPLQRFVFEPGAVDKLVGEVRALGASRALVVCGGNTRRSRLFARVTEQLGDLWVATFDQVVEHSSTRLVTEGAERAREAEIDALVAVGGGSASDTAKAVAILLAEGGRIEDHASRFEPPDRFFSRELHRPKLPVIAIPTTASAAEVTPGLGIRASDGTKLLFWDIKLASRVILLDPVANLEVPVALMASTAMNGFAHCAEGLYSRLRNPISEGLALQGARLFAKAVPAMVAEPDNPDHRGQVLAAAALSGMVISNARVGIHHAVCHCLGALGGLSHGVANAIMLPHALRYNVDVAAGELRGLAEALGVPVAGKSDAFAAEAAIDAVRELQRKAKVPNRLRDTGLDRNLLPRIAEHTLLDRGLFFNPKRTATSEPVLRLLEGAW